MAGNDRDAGAVGGEPAHAVARQRRCFDVSSSPTWSKCPSTLPVMRLTFGSASGT